MARSGSLWIDTASPDHFSPLLTDARADVCVVGAGIAGLTTAYLLAREGKSVVLLDDGRPGCGQTGMTTAHLAYQIDDSYQEIIRLHGVEGARLAYHSHRSAIDRIESIVQLERIDCDFERVSGYLFPAEGHGAREIDSELEAARAAGVSVQRLDAAPVKGFYSGACLHFPRHGQFHPLKYLNGLAAGFLRLGGVLHTGTRAVSVTGGNTAVVGTADGRTVTAAAAVIATNVPFNDKLTIHTKQAPYHTYVIAARVAPGAITHALYWDTADPYHYVRLQRVTNAQLGGDNPDPIDLLIVGGEDHKAGQAQDAESRFGNLETWMRAKFPAARDVEFRWSGQVMETQDGLGFIGRNPLDANNVYVATGDSGMGMTHGTIAGILLTDLIAGRPNAWTDLYDPSRIRSGAAGEFVKENLNVALQYTAWLTGGEVSSVEEIAPNTGAVIREGLRKVAVFRDEAGELHRHSAVCTHLGCIVAWNPAASTWDCPCHGSRFDPKGSVVNGPAQSDLAEG
jgi:glycine/D-amino acid oxidase-like deaminating enzyme/nitrite reductase/ring-hydroxylating ferredoxin subunit